MKQSRDNSAQQSKPVQNTKQQRPQNKDDIDSRSGEEQTTKGNDVTHNQREKQSDRKNVKNDD